MPKNLNPASVELRKAFGDYEREVRIRNSKVGSILAIVLVPAGIGLDYFVYPEQVWRFLNLRLLCSLCVCVVFILLFTRFGQRFYRTLGSAWYLFPAAMIVWMIHVVGGFSSPYYAGLNIVLLTVSAILPWAYRANALGAVLIIIFYLGACLTTRGARDVSLLFNNVYFLVLTAVIVMTGSYFHRQLAFREFCLRYELDKNRALLEENNRKLLALDQVKSRFFANISHELRTPLTLLIAPLESLLHEKIHSLDSQVQDWLKTMHRNALRLLKLINDLLDLVRLESAKMEVVSHPVEMESFVRGLIHSIRKVAEDKGIMLDSSTARDVGTVLADKDKMERILLNLLFNAVKFTPAGGQINVVVRKEESALVMEVRDTGMGIAEDQLPRIFERFWQADSSSIRRQQGTGIGLALTKELVEVQGGKISVESKEGQGSVMRVSLPFVATTGNQAQKGEETFPHDSGISESPTERDGTGVPIPWVADLYRRAEYFPSLALVHETLPSTEIPHDRNRPHLLVADDEPDMLRFLKSQLKEHFEVIEAADGRQAIDKAGQFLPNIILCDMMMPEKDGLDVCRELRNQVSTRNIPIIMLTAKADEETKLAVLSAGASDFLTKPFSTTELHVRIKNLADSYHWQQQLAKQNQILEATVDELHETQTQLVQSEKLASLGCMSAGIIHEINNPLNYIGTALYTLKTKGDFVSEERKVLFGEIVQDVEEGMNRVKTIISDLRLFAHSDSGQFQNVPVKELVSVALRMLAHEWKDKIKVEFHAPEGQSISANRAQFVHIIVNLVQNAIDALKNKRFENEEPAIWIEGKIEGDKNFLTIRDNGEGIPVKNIDKIFDPFFTTKEVGAGMGLGLSICYNLIQGHHGKISVRSDPGKGTEFILELPANRIG